MKLESLHPAEQIAEIMGRVYSSGLTTASGGNISMLDADDSLWITPGGVDKGTLKPEDMVRVRPGGSVEGRHKPSIELPFHQRIYAVRKDARAVLHAHPSSLVAYSIVGMTPDPRLFPELPAICGVPGFAPYAPPGSAALGERIAGAFAAGSNCVVLENHGAVSAGSSLPEAYRAFEALDFCAGVAIAAQALGGAKPISPEELAAIANRGASAAYKPLLQPGAGRGESAREELCRIVRRAAARGLLRGGLGEFSLRLDETAFLITPAEADGWDIGPEDLVRVEGTLCEAGKRPGRLAALHGSVYARQPRVNAVALARPVSAMAFAASGAAPDTRLIPESYVLLRGMPLLPCAPAYLDPENSMGILGPETPAAVVRNGFLISTGADALAAFDRLEVAEFSARAVLMAGGLGRVSPMEGERLAEIERIYNL